MQDRVLETGRGEIVTWRQSTADAAILDFLPCPDCLAFFMKRHLWKHSKTCRGQGDVKKQKGEASKLLITSYVSRNTKPPREDVVKSLTKLEQQLCNELTRLEIREASENEDEQLSNSKQLSTSRKSVSHKRKRHISETVMTCDLTLHCCDLQKPQRMKMNNSLTQNNSLPQESLSVALLHTNNTL
ncbi:unnamed protein product [Leuciscus chuanchicus]